VLHPVSQRGQQRRLFAIYLLLGLIIGYVTSQTNLIGTATAAALITSGMLRWRKKRPADLAIATYWRRVLIALMYLLIFLGGYLVVRKSQPTNYRANDLAALAILSLLLALPWLAISAASRSEMTRAAGQVQLRCGLERCVDSKGVAP
jgi:cytochrome bd-type quinol oxidase subunit 1